jgi:transcriptional regulator with XRE-family HTH domain
LRFAQSLRERRFELGWTQARLAAAMGVQPSDVTRWERGDSLPPAATIRKAARVLDVAPEIARAWLEEVGAAPQRAIPEISVRLVTDEQPADPFLALGAATRPSRPVASSPTAPIAPRVREAGTGVVFPSYAPPVVYSSDPLPPRGTRPSLGRVARTAAVLGALAGVLWWAMGQLGSGLAALFDLFGGPPDTGGLGG